MWGGKEEVAMVVLETMQSNHQADSHYQMTLQQAEAEMRSFQKVFSIVRLLKKEELECIGQGETDTPVCQCFAFWEKGAPCENCISLETLRDKQQHTKMEFLGDDIYQVFSRYVEVDGTPCVMECIQKLDDDSLVSVHERDKLIRKLSKYHTQLYRDALTGAYNRRYFENKLKNMQVTGGVAMIDLDDFKVYNDTFGHDVGDAVLQTVVRTVRSCMQEHDVLIRYGGDEFVLMLPDISERDFAEKLEQIRESVQEAAVSGYVEIHLTVSIGGYYAVNFTLENAIHNADKLMYQAKNQKNAVVTSEDATPEMDSKQNILIVDDSEMNREILAEMLGSEYKIYEAANGKECMQLLDQYGTGISLVLLDILMPVMDGFEVLHRMAERHCLEDIPVIMISSEDSADAINKAYALGVSDYISRPFDARVVYRRVSNAIKLYAKQRRLVTVVSEQMREKDKNNNMMISILSQIVEFRNRESGSHVIHIKRLTSLLLESLKRKNTPYQITNSDQFLIPLASALHDIGKIGIDEKILNKPGRLTKEEFEIMKTHTVIGADMLSSLTTYQAEPLVRIAHDICRWHHERYDGRGYPDGLKGDQIPISAQVVSLADVYDALVSERVYKKAFTHEKAIDMILHGECGSFNPILLECLLDIQDTLKRELVAQSENAFQFAQL